MLGRRVFEMKISVIKDGYLLRDKNGFILDARSSVTLIQSEGRNIIVDTSIPSDKNKILAGLVEHDLSPVDIDLVINTHLHMDHCGNNNLFTKAKFIAHLKEAPIATKKNVIINGDYEINDKIKIFETPGHTFGSISVLVDSDEKYVIAGDALPLKDNYLQWVPPGINIGPALALKSMRKIVDLADIVVPGHDKIFSLNSEK
jgi:glyoxylase-like metal-dependent hydrolase (beta-lactamase superfamily II)